MAAQNDMTVESEIDPRTPVVVGVGQFSERIDDADYRALSAVGLAAEAASAALADSGGDVAALAAAVDTVGGIRQFEISTPVAWAPLGRSNNFPRSVARRVGADPARAILEMVGGQGPQHLVSDVAGQIARGDVRVALLFGSEAISTVRHCADAPDRPDFTETVPGDLEDRGLGIEGLVTPSALGHGLTDAACQYAMLENARRARLGRTRGEYARGMGELFAPFSRVAAGNPHAAAPTERGAAELVEPSPRNRLVADPYTRYVVARDQVNQGAAVLIMSVGAARELGIGQDRWVFLHGRADLRERELLERQDLSESPASVMAARLALASAGVTVADLATLDLYSCFPIAVSNVADGLGLSADDPRGLTLTGGLPFFGGAGNDYSMHAIAETVDRCRKEPGSFGFVGANGGILSKYSAAVYSTAPTAWPVDRSAQAQAEIDRWPAIASTDRADGWATVETYTVKYAKDGGRLAIVIGRLEDTGERFYANDVEGDAEFLDWLTGGEPIGARVYVRSFDRRNRVALTEVRMNELGRGAGGNC